ncbi:unnamed protein product [marine sediment metagenome]|uniref:Glycine zipper domain-containing protein n=1 Tax=marine sediment metagenome TaxID=412755 RepID=X1IJN3_9ZZZZ
MLPWLKISCPFCGIQNIYNPNEIFAEEGKGAPLTGTAIGAIVGGLIGGPAGLILGGALGGTVGLNSEQKEKEIAEKFNKEFV